ncbi:hypothetical protein ACOMHN_023489 [Nucella lapillus]
MYKGGSLVTARGTGTNGFLHNNNHTAATSAAAMKHRGDNPRGGGGEDGEGGRRKRGTARLQGSADIASHELKRRVELKCMEYQEHLEEQGSHCREVGGEWVFSPCSIQFSLQRSGRRVGVFAVFYPVLTAEKWAESGCFRRVLSSSHCREVGGEWVFSPCSIQFSLQRSGRRVGVFAVFYPVLTAEKWAESGCFRRVLSSSHCREVGGECVFSPCSIQFSLQRSGRRVGVFAVFYPVLTAEKWAESGCFRRVLSSSHCREVGGEWVFSPCSIQFSLQRSGRRVGVFAVFYPVLTAEKWAESGCFRRVLSSSHCREVGGEWVFSPCSIQFSLQRSGRRVGVFAVFYPVLTAEKWAESGCFRRVLSSSHCREVGGEWVFSPCSIQFSLQRSGRRVGVFAVFYPVLTAEKWAESGCFRRVLSSSHCREVGGEWVFSPCSIQFSLQRSGRRVGVFAVFYPVLTAEKWAESGCFRRVLSSSHCREVGGEWVFSPCSIQFSLQRSGRRVGVFAVFYPVLTAEKWAESGCFRRVLSSSHCREVGGEWVFSPCSIQFSLQRSGRRVGVFAVFYPVLTAEKWAESGCFRRVLSSSHCREVGGEWVFSPCSIQFSLQRSGRRVGVFAVFYPVLTAEKWAESVCFRRVLSSSHCREVGGEWVFSPCSIQFSLQRSGRRVGVFAVFYPVLTAEKWAESGCFRRVLSSSHCREVGGEWVFSPCSIQFSLQRSGRRVGVFAVFYPVLTAEKWAESGCFRRVLSSSHCREVGGEWVFSPCSIQFSLQRSGRRVCVFAVFYPVLTAEKWAESGCFRRVLSSSHCREVGGEWVFSPCSIQFSLQRSGRRVGVFAVFYPVLTAEKWAESGCFRRVLSSSHCREVGGEWVFSPCSIQFSLQRSGRRVGVFAVFYPVLTAEKWAESGCFRRVLSSSHCREVGGEWVFSPCSIQFSLQRSGRRVGVFAVFYPVLTAEKWAESGCFRRVLSSSHCREVGGEWVFSPCSIQFSLQRSGRRVGVFAVFYPVLTAEKWAESGCFRRVLSSSHCREVGGEWVFSPCSIQFSLQRSGRRVGVFAVFYPVLTAEKWAESGCFRRVLSSSHCREVGGEWVFSPCSIQFSLQRSGRRVGVFAVFYPVLTAEKWAESGCFRRVLSSSHCREVGGEWVFSPCSIQFSLQRSGRRVGVFAVFYPVLTAEKWAESGCFRRVLSSSHCREVGGEWVFSPCSIQFSLQRSGRRVGVFAVFYPVLTAEKWAESGCFHRVLSSSHCREVGGEWVFSPCSIQFSLQRSGRRVGVFAVFYPVLTAEKWAESGCFRRVLSSSHCREVGGEWVFSPCSIQFSLQRSGRRVGVFAVFYPVLTAEKWAESGCFRRVLSSSHCREVGGEWVFSPCSIQFSLQRSGRRVGVFAVFYPVLTAEKWAESGCFRRVLSSSHCREVGGEWVFSPCSIQFSLQRSGRRVGVFAVFYPVLTAEKWAESGCFRRVLSSSHCREVGGEWVFSPCSIQFSLQRSGRRVGVFAVFYPVLTAEKWAESGCFRRVLSSSHCREVGGEWVFSPCSIQFSLQRSGRRVGVFAVFYPVLTAEKWAESGCFRRVLSSSHCREVGGEWVFSPCSIQFSLQRSGRRVGVFAVFYPVLTAEKWAESGCFRRVLSSSHCREVGGEWVFSPCSIQFSLQRSGRRVGVFAVFYPVLTAEKWAESGCFRRVLSSSHCREVGGEWVFSPCSIQFSLQRSGRRVGVFAVFYPVLTAEKWAESGCFRRVLSSSHCREVGGEWVFSPCSIQFSLQRSGRRVGVFAVFYPVLTAEKWAESGCFRRVLSSSHCREVGGEWVFSPCSIQFSLQRSGRRVGVFAVFYPVLTAEKWAESGCFRRVLSSSHCREVGGEWVFSPCSIQFSLQRSGRRVGVFAVFYPVLTAEKWAESGCFRCVLSSSHCREVGGEWVFSPCSIQFSLQRSGRRVGVFAVFYPVLTAEKWAESGCFRRVLSSSHCREVGGEWVFSPCSIQFSLQRSGRRVGVFAVFYPVLTAEKWAESGCFRRVLSSSHCREVGGEWVFSPCSIQFSLQRSGRRVGVFAVFYPVLTAEKWAESGCFRRVLSSSHCREVGGEWVFSPCSIQFSLQRSGRRVGVFAVFYPVLTAEKWAESGCFRRVLSSSHCREVGGEWVFSPCSIQFSLQRSGRRVGVFAVFYPVLTAEKWAESGCFRRVLSSSHCREVGGEWVFSPCSIQFSLQRSGRRVGVFAVFYPVLTAEKWAESGCFRRVLSSSHCREVGGEWVFSPCSIQFSLQRSGRRVGVFAVFYPVLTAEKWAGPGLDQGMLLAGRHQITFPGRGEGQK